MRIRRTWITAIGLSGAAALSLSAAHAGGGVTFTRLLDAGPAVTDSIRLFGGSWADWNHDGNLDQYVVGQSIRGYEGDGAGTFTSAGGDFVSNPGGHWHTMGIWADWNEDGWQDLYLANYGTLLSNLSFVSPGPDRLFQNAGPPTFALVPVPLDPDSTASVAPSWVDYDRDGDLDLHVSCSQGTQDLFYRNDGGSFVKLTALSFLNAHTEGAVSMWVDVDDDGDEDLYVVNHGAPNELYLSRLADVGNPNAFITVTTGPLVTDGAEFDISAEWADYDQDGDLDAFIPVANGGVDKLFRNDGGGTFASLTNAMTIAGSSTFGAWGDYDNDGDLDLVVGQIAFAIAAPRVFRNDAGTFVSVPSGLGSIHDPINRVQAGQWGDIDNDGDLDLYAITFSLNQNALSGPAPNFLYRNDNTTGNHWLFVRCEGTASNRSAIGARVHVVATIGGSSVRQTNVVWGSMAGNSEQPDARLHFGLGDASVVDTITVEWPSGLVQTETNLPVDQLLAITEGQTVATPEVTPSPGRLVASAHPNPFRVGTTIRWDRASNGPVTIRLYDASGRLVRTLVGSGGDASLRWDGQNAHGGLVAPGVYFYRLTTPGGQGSGSVARME